MKSILIIINDQNFYLSHRRYIYKKFRQYKIYCLCFKKVKFKKIDHVNFISLDMSLYSMNIFILLKAWFKILNITKYLKVDLIHVYGIRPILFSSILYLYKKNKLMTFTGMGLLKNSNKFKYIIIYKFLIRIFTILNKNKFIKFNFQDPNQKIFKKNFNFKSTALIESEFFKRKLFNKKIKNIIIISRLIYSKGIYKLLKYSKYNPNINFHIIGKYDSAHPDSINKTDWNLIRSKKNIFYLGFKKNIKSYLSNSDALLFLSDYGEGIPRVILEASALTIPILSEKKCSIPINMKKYIFMIKDFRIENHFIPNYFYTNKKKIYSFYDYVFKIFFEENVYKANSKIYRDLINN